MRSLLLYAWLLILTCGNSYGQNVIDAKKDDINASPKYTATPFKSNRNYVYTRHQYPDANGAGLIIINSFPKSGINYTAPNGEKYVYAVFWTQFTNEAKEPLELKIDFPVDSFELPSAPGNFIKLLIPSDTMTLEKTTKFDYGLNVKTFLDNGRHKSSSLKRVIKPKESNSFYVVPLSNRGVNGTLRTEFYIKEQSLFYKINDKEIYCGSIKIKN
ncbi:hypothetical protein [Pedobacter mucosus]|uniref:hypothetical protein n=1 Tax=Pedobacter mucosus TaxID=2895286 RepID=UPI001EE3A898|nr:hypothetical protein [Pedobacter mucosus]UKT64671.1 hypothetical protein LOK61_02580 [Pedobacter mucosus]